MDIGDYTAKSNELQKILKELNLGEGRKIVQSLRICDMLWIRKKKKFHSASTNGLIKELFQTSQQNPSGNMLVVHGVPS